MADGFDTSELSAFTNSLIKDIKDVYPKKMKKFVHKETKSLSDVAEEIAKNELKEDTGNYLKGFEVGRSGLKDKFSLKAYNDAKHSHLIEDGYVQIGRGENRSKGAGRRVGTKPTGNFVAGKKIFARAQVKYKAQFEKNTEEFIGDMLYESVCEKHITQQANKLGVSEDEIKRAMK